MAKCLRGNCVCPQYSGKHNLELHTPGGGPVMMEINGRTQVVMTSPFRPGKTKRDRQNRAKR